MYLKINIQKPCMYLIYQVEFEYEKHRHPRKNKNWSMFEE